MKQILLLEDDQSFGYILSEYLSMHKLSSVWAKSAEEALELLPRYEFKLALLDIMLPGMDGFAFAEKLHAHYPQIPFIFISAKSLKIDQLKGYKLGAFDYITKPIDEELLVAKVKALLAISTKPKEQPGLSEYHIGQYSFNPNEQSLSLGGQVKTLTTREAELLKMLAEHPNRILLRKDALQKIWGSTDEFSRKSMDVFISHLRKYLSADKQVTIKNVHGKGFILQC